MKVLVLGATGQTGYHVVKQLIENSIQVKAIVRNVDKFKDIQSNKNLKIFRENILDIEDEIFKEILADVDVVISCLGHNISLKGIFGNPHYLVTEAINKTIRNGNDKNLKKIVLMNTTACLNTHQKEKFTFFEAIIMGIMRSLLPPQRDNERALKFLEENYKGENNLEWIAVRPDTLITQDQVTEYEVFESPQRSPIFNAGKTSRINVANVIMKLVSNEGLWNKWKYKMPVIYNKKKK
jgi:putative NADH-flavin reductase